MKWLVVLGVVAIAATWVLLAGTNSGAPQITYDGGRLSPTCVVSVTKDQIKDWPISQNSVSLFEYAKGPAVAKIGNYWYSLNGLAVSWSRKERIAEEGRLELIHQLDALPTLGPVADAGRRSRSFLLDLNDLVNRRCPT